MKKPIDGKWKRKESLVFSAGQCGSTAAAGCLLNYIKKHAVRRAKEKTDTSRSAGSSAGYHVHADRS